MKKLLQINITLNSGSTGKIVELIGDFVKENNWESYAAYSRGSSNNSKLNVIKIGSKISPYKNALTARIFDNDGFLAKNDTKKLIEQIDEIKPDIIHLHNLHGYFIDIEQLLNYIKVNNIPTFLTMHDCWIFTGHCAYFDIANCYNWKTKCENCPQKNQYPTSYVFDNSSNNFEKKISLFNSLKNFTFVPVSNWLSDLLSESKLKKLKSQTIHNGIDLSVFKKVEDNNILQKYKLPKNFILGVSNVWTKEKGFDDFLEIAKQRPDYKIVLVGLTKKQLTKLPQNIKGILRTENQTDLAKIYSAAKVFFNPTYQDNYPTINLESIATGTPVITYKTGGSPEAIGENCGYVTTQGNLTEAIKIIDKILNEPKSIYENSCIEFAKNNFDKNIFLKKYLDLYEEILKLRK